MSPLRLPAVILAALAVLAGPHVALTIAHAVLIAAVAVTVAAIAILMLLIIRRILGDLPAAALVPLGGVT